LLTVDDLKEALVDRFNSSLFTGSIAHDSGHKVVTIAISVFFVQVFQPQQGANTLIEWVFVNDQSGIPQMLGWAIIV